jgi:adenylate cyclase
MFVDIGGFTHFSEGKPGPVVVKRLNEFFSVVSEIIFTHGGMLDK